MSDEVYCHREEDYFPTSEFRTVGGKQVHQVEPPHYQLTGRLLTERPKHVPPPPAAPPPPRR